MVPGSGADVGSTRGSDEDKRLAAWMNPKNLPFDARRMIFGGFRPLVTL